MRLALLPLLLALAACDAGPGANLDVGEFRGTVAGARASGFVLHDVPEARDASAATFSVRADLFVEGEEDQPTYLVLRLPLATPIEAADLAVGGDVVAEVVSYAEDGTATVLETARTGTVGLFRPEDQGRRWFRLHGTVDLAFPSGAVVGTFRATPRSGHPVSHCDALGCTDY